MGTFDCEHPVDLSAPMGSNSSLSVMIWLHLCMSLEPLGERKNPGGQVTLLISAPTFGRKSGYQLRNVFSHSSLSTLVRIWSRRCAPRVSVQSSPLVLAWAWA